MQLQPETWKTWGFPGEFPLTLGGSLPGFTLAYETWGRLNERRDNAVAVLHALSGSSHVRSSAEHPAPGWWEKFLDGSGPLRPDRHFIVCANLLGGCYGSTGPLSADPRTGRRYMVNFPPLAIEDMVNSFRLLLRSLGVERGLTVIGGSMGGMLALDWAARFPGEVRQAIALASPGKSYAQTIALRAVQREAILADPDWQDGWYDERRRPVRGLALARKIGIITYRSDREFRERFGREVLDPRPHFREGKFQVQSYLDHQGEKFVQRFDPNTYLYYSRAMDLFDLGQGFGSLEEGLRRIRARCLLVGFDTDILCPLYQVEEVHRALASAGAGARMEVISTPHGHDAFLIELEALNRAVEAFLE
jgi:homoserine O-acetyltransferase/O-succinyltransferase